MNPLLGWWNKGRRACAVACDIWDLCVVQVVGSSRYVGTLCVLVGLFFLALAVAGKGEVSMAGASRGGGRTQYAEPSPASTLFGRLFTGALAAFFVGAGASPFRRRPKAHP